MRAHDRLRVRKRRNTKSSPRLLESDKRSYDTDTLEPRMLWRPLVDVTRRRQYKLSKGSAPIGGGVVAGWCMEARSELRARAHFCMCVRV